MPVRFAWHTWEVCELTSRTTLQYLQPLRKKNFMLLAMLQLEHKLGMQPPKTLTTPDKSAISERQAGAIAMRTGF